MREWQYKLAPLTGTVGTSAIFVHAAAMVESERIRRVTRIWRSPT